MFIVIPVMSMLRDLSILSAVEKGMRYLILGLSGKSQVEDFSWFTADNRNSNFAIMKRRIFGQSVRFRGRYGKKRDF